MYPSKPKQPRLPDDGDIESITLYTPGAPVAEVPSPPRAVGGAPKLGTDLLRNLDRRQRPPRATGSGGPERWDTPARDIFSGDNGRYLTTNPPHSYTAVEISADYPKAVEAFRDKLLTVRSKMSDQKIAKSDFWRRFDTQGQAFVAQLLGDVMGVLTSRARLYENADTVEQLTEEQRDWLASHPLTKWMNWF